MKKLLLYFQLISIIFTLSTCTDEHLSQYSYELWKIQDQATTNVNFQGFIFDANYKPVIGAEVKTGNSTAITNELGVFFLNEVSVSANNAIVTISKPGYFTCVKSLRVVAGDDNVIKVQLVERKLAGSLESKDGGTVSLSSGTSVKIPSNGLIDSLTGQKYTGKVNVYMHWMDPSDVNILYRMPGELRGISAAGEERMMITYGMTTVELEGASGQKLQLSKEAKAKITFEVPTSIELEAPKTIPLWFYDESKGRWFEEGIAKLVNGKYEGEVSHFTTWNCDVAYEQPMLKFCLKVKDEFDVPYANAHILIHRANDKWGGHGYTNSQGIVCGLIPYNTPLVLDVLGEPSCEQSILSKPIGPYTTDIEIDTVIVKRNPEKMITVTGNMLDCKGNPVKSGYVQAQISYRPSIGKVTNGKFEFTVSRCPADNEITVVGVESTTFKYSNPISKKISGNKIDVGTIITCTDIFGTMTDIDGNIYKTIKIGNQTWMAENLRVGHFKNGESIPNVTDDIAWSQLNTPAWCNYNNDSQWDPIYGKLYNYWAVKDSRGLAPMGWHIATSTEWDTLFAFLGGRTVAGGKLKSVDNNYWELPNVGANNITGFTGLPGGFRANYGGFLHIGQDAWWNTPDNPPIFWNLYYMNEEVNARVLFGFYNYLSETSGVSVRCIKD